MEPLLMRFLELAKPFRFAVDRHELSNVVRHALTQRVLGLQLIDRTIRPMFDDAN